MTVAPIRLTPKNNQQAFDLAVRHLLQMEKRSGYFDSEDDYDHKCLYRTPDGNKCVIGAMIPDDEYDPVIDTDETFSSIMGLCSTGYITTYPDVDVMLLDELQQCHDAKRNWAADGFTQVGVLRNIAKRYNISCSIFDVIYLENKES